MLWDLYGEMSGQVFRSWNTCVKLAWGLPRSTHNYFVEQLLAKEFSSVRKRILLQYASFLQRLGRSVNSEIRIMSRIVACDVRSVTARNCLNMVREFSLDPLIVPAFKFKKEYKMYEVPEHDHWRPSLLSSLLREKYELNVTGENTKTSTELIKSLCSS